MPQVQNSFVKTIINQEMWETLEQKRDIDFSYSIAEIVRFFRCECVSTNGRNSHLLFRFIQGNSQCRQV